MIEMIIIEMPSLFKHVFSILNEKCFFSVQLTLMSRRSAMCWRTTTMQPATYFTSPFMITVRPFSNCFFSVVVSGLLSSIRALWTCRNNQTFTVKYLKCRGGTLAGTQDVYFSQSTEGCWEQSPQGRRKKKTSNNVCLEHFVLFSEVCLLSGVHWWREPL